MNPIIILTVLLTVQLHLATSLTWNGNFNNFPASWKVKVGNSQLHSIVKDPFNSSVNVLKITHPKGSCSSECGKPNGAMFDVKPFAGFNGNVATLTYEVFFHGSFNFVKGGKLPGIIGGGKGCSGCTTDVGVRDNCFSARFMWGKNGNGYPYLYLPLSVQHDADFCSKISGSQKCKGVCGWDFMPSQYFAKNKWTQIKERITLNTPGQKNGRLEVWLNGNKIIDYKKIIYRTKSSVGITGFTVHPFFGGGKDWATPVDTYTMYKNFRFTDY